MLKQKTVISLLVVLVLFTGAGADLYAQCGVHFKRESTQAIPFSKVYLNGAIDFTGDGRLDLLASQDAFGQDSTRERILIIPYSANRTLESPITIDAPAGNTFDSSYMAANVNNDASKDLILFNDYSTNPTTMWIYFNNGSGTFGAPVVSNATQMGRLSHFVDIDNDGIRDYLGHMWSSDYRYSLGNGDGTFDPPVTIFTDHGAPAPGDFNGDGKVDLIDSNHVHLNNGDTTFGTIAMTPSFNFNEAIWSITDFNGDGKSDLLVKTNSSGPSGFSIFISPGTTFTRTDYTVDPSPSWGGGVSVANMGG